MKFYYFDQMGQTITHEEYPTSDYWDHDSDMSTNFKTIKKHAIEQIQEEIARARESLKYIRSMRITDVQPTK